MLGKVEKVFFPVLGRCRSPPLSSPGGKKGTFFCFSCHGILRQTFLWIRIFFTNKRLPQKKRNQKFLSLQIFFWRFLIVAFPFLYLISLPMNSKKKPWDTALNRTATYTPIKQSGFSSAGNRPNNRHSITSLSLPPLLWWVMPCFFGDARQRFSQIRWLQGGFFSSSFSVVRELRGVLEGSVSRSLGFLWSGFAVKTAAAAAAT